MSNPHPTPSFKPGVSGNPNGRPPKGYSITETFQEMFKADPLKKQELADAIFKRAKQGDPTALKLVWNYMDGMPQQKLDHTTNGKDLPTPLLSGVTDVPSNNGSTEAK